MAGVDEGRSRAIQSTKSELGHFRRRARRSGRTRRLKWRVRPARTSGDGRPGAKDENGALAHTALPKTPLKGDPSTSG
jgi:hypothetical protein